MAAGDTLMVFDPLSNRPPESGFAKLDVRNGFVVLDFPSDEESTARFHSIVPHHFHGGGFVFAIKYTSDVVGPDSAEMSIELSRILAGDNIDSAMSVLGQVDFSLTGSTTQGELNEVTTSPVAISGLSAGDLVVLGLSRKALDAADSLAGDLEMLSIEVREG